MKTKQIAIFLCLVTIGSLSSCKKKSSDPEPEPVVVVTPPVNKLCDGNGSTTSYYPLDSTNAWTYGYKIMGVSQSVHPSPKVTGHQIFNGVKYAHIYDSSTWMDLYLREDAVNHNIYRYDDNNSVEYLEVPGTPTLNQSWSIGNSNTRKVVNLSASKNTGGCSYTGLLEISELNSNFTVTKTIYYKKGLGMVYSVEVGSFPDEYTLTSVTLK